MRLRLGQAILRLDGGRTRAGFSLAELVLALGVMSILMTGLTSAILVAAHAMPDDDAPAITTAESADVLDQLIEDLRVALWFLERSPQALTFTVPDRDGDDLPERIRYAWAGTPGDPLTRQYNGGTAVDVREDVREFSFLPALRAVTEEYPGPAVESGEQLLKSYDSAVSLSEVHVHDNSWWAEYFEPALPAAASTWKVSRVLFVAKRDHDLDYTTTIQLCVPDANKYPSDIVIDQTTLKQLSLLNTFAWIERSFSNAGGLSPRDGLCLTFTTTYPNSARLCYRSGGVTASGLGWIEGNPAWMSLVTDQSALFYVYGTYSTQGPPQTATRQYVTGARVALRAGNDAASRVVTAAETLNLPELLTGCWETDFEADPRLDHNGDGSGDWSVGSGTFNPGSLVGGIWYADSKLVTFPANDFTGLTTATVRFRSTSVVGGGAVFCINADWSGGTYAPISARVQLQADGSQTLTVSRQTDELTAVRLVGVTGLSGGFVELRLTIDPGLDTVGVTVNGAHHGTFRYSKFIPAQSQRYVTIYPDGSNAEFEYVSIRVSE